MTATAAIERLLPVRLMARMPISLDMRLHVPRLPQAHTPRVNKCQPCRGKLHDDADGSDVAAAYMEFLQSRTFGTQ
ncbi:MAG: hypothetical protein QOG64_1441 [Acidimicrobiaceae bacterium]|nr:hypothetical protein [Acidimicrobiaceae bacterium]